MTRVPQDDKIAIPEIEEMLNPLLHAMHGFDGPAHIREIDQKVIEAESYTEEQLAVRSGSIGSAKSDIAFRLGFARTWLKDFGLLENVSSGMWQLSHAGKLSFRVDATKVRKAYESARRRRQAERQDRTKHSDDASSEAGNVAFLQKLESLITERKSSPPAESYTAGLFAAGPNKIAQKVGEEATEVIVAALGETREAQVNELADLLYHTLVLMAQLDISLDEVCAELERRHRPR